MLRELVELAERERLVASEDFEEKPVDFEIRIDTQGRCLGLVSLRDESGKGKRMQVPRFPLRTSGVASGFLVENCKYVLGIGDPEKDKPDRLTRCREAFVALVRGATKSTNDPALAAVSRFYDDFDRNRRVLVESVPGSEWTGSEILVFYVDGLGFAHERLLVRQFWAGSRELAVDTAEAGRCLVTGRLGAIERKHPMVKRVPGGQTSGSALVSFNASSFTSHGLEQGENATVSRSAAIAYTTALNWMLERVGDRRYRHGVSIGDASVALYWTSGPAASLNFFADLWNGPRKEEAERFWEAPWRGLPPPELDSERFYAVVLSGNAARVVVRSWYEATVGRVKTALRRYFGDLAIGRDPLPLPIWQLVAALDPPGNAEPPPELAGRMFAASVTGAPLPRELLRHALLRIRAGAGRAAEPASLLRARFGIIKATLNGIWRRQAVGALKKEVTVTLDRDNDQPAYNLGRLFAALERAQQNALGGDVNATIRDRYFGAASTTPATVFPRLLRLAQHHVSKARSENREWGVEKWISQIVNHLPPEGFPPLLSLEGQGLFAVGYYHQREAFFEKRKTESDRETGNPEKE
jgi:CRISPR-associated protein Csd1